jgi:hypothetical protein
MTCLLAGTTLAYYVTKSLGDQVTSAVWRLAGRLPSRLLQKYTTLKEKPLVGTVLLAIFFYVVLGRIGSMGRPIGSMGTDRRTIRKHMKHKPHTSGQRTGKIFLARRYFPSPCLGCSPRGTCQ